MTDDDYIRKSVQRRAAFAALRQIRRLVDEDTRREAANRRWAAPIGTALALAAITAVVWIAFH